MRRERVALVAVLGIALGASACGGSEKPPRPGNAVKGAQIFAQKCASCHGAGGKGGTAPKIAGEPILYDTAKARIDGGGSGMPAGLVTGQDEADVLAYVAQISSG